MGLNIIKPQAAAVEAAPAKTLPWEETPEGIAAAQKAADDEAAKKEVEQQAQTDALAAKEVTAVPDLPELIDLFSWRMGSRAVMDVMKENPATAEEVSGDGWAAYLNRILPKIIKRRDEAHAKQENTLEEYQQFAEKMKGYLAPALEVDPAVATLADILAAAASIEQA